ncbi:thiamine-phosphate kinase [Actinopolymorpha singaporensis]|uniref:Thiamine-monophosphate kinase n=1 Tax=Actinopolymorpha singaporensis TaxID=117157 RepID=A0A1H1Y4R4_9ACTN|nr:thiamine-phosphate kinase [Actinopolymorpha singaporensis]SDT16423.1 thiamine-phosphate kinase [Actinopolymorpha singaporensis]
MPVTTAVGHGTMWADINDARSGAAQVTQIRGTQAGSRRPAGGTEGVGGTVAELGEFGLIAAMSARLPTGPDVLLGPGDDAAVISAPDSRVVATTDMLVEGRHFRRDWSPAYDVGRKAAAQNLADVAAMGAVPTALLVSFGAPPDLPAQWALEFTEGLRDETAAAGASVAGGDVVASGPIVVSITALGTLQGREALTRSGARPGDVVAVCGRLGWSAAGLTVLGRGFRSPRVVVEAHRRPEPPYDAGPEAAALGASALIDVSDGLLADLGHVARASGVRIDVDTGTLDVAEPLRAVAAAINADPLAFVLTGGEDHALAATFGPDVELPERWQVVGRVLAAEEQGEREGHPEGRPRESGEPPVTVNGEEYEGPAGHDHFR